MKIKHVSRMAGPDGVFHPGTIREIDDEIGAQLIAGGYAASVEEPSEAEAAPKPEEGPAVDPPPKPAPKPEPKEPRPRRRKASE